jgi:hypothetical protein
MGAVKAQRAPVTAAFSSLPGSCIEWYDFHIYGTARRRLQHDLLPRRRPRLRPLSSQQLVGALPAGREP